MGQRLWDSTGEHAAELEGLLSREGTEGRDEAMTGRSFHSPTDLPEIDWDYIDEMLAGDQTGMGVSFSEDNAGEGSSGQQ